MSSAWGSHNRPGICPACAGGLPWMIFISKSLPAQASAAAKMSTACYCVFPLLSDFFRFGLNCAGEARLDRFLIRRGFFTHTTDAKWGRPARRTQHLTPGGLGSRDAICASTPTAYSCSVYGTHHYHLADWVSMSARLGQKTVTVNFSDLKVYRLLVKASNAVQLRARLKPGDDDHDAQAPIQK